MKWEFDLRFPVRYTASNSPRRTSRTARGNPWPSVLLRGEPMTSLLTARRQHLSAAYALHSRSKSVRLRTPPLPRLISPLWQGTASLCFTNLASRCITFRERSEFRPGIALRQDAPAPISETVSVVDPRATGQEICEFSGIWVPHPYAFQGCGFRRSLTRTKPTISVAPHSPSSLTFTSFTTAISEITIARVPFRSNAIPVARTYFPTNGINLVR